MELLCNQMDLKLLVEITNLHISTEPKSSRLEKHNSLIPKVEENKALCFVGHERAKIPPYNYVPMW